MLAAWGSPMLESTGDKTTGGPQVGQMATRPMPPGRSPNFKAGHKIRGGPQVGRVAR